jgi:hypothetical protein
MREKKARRFWIGSPIGYQIFKTNPDVSQQEGYQIAYTTFLSAASVI